MIPKKIHYCWFGKNKLPDKAIKCINSWKKYCPDYEIIEWNEDNFDVRQNGYTEFTYDNRKFAFLSDYARLQIVLKEGGLYFDVDVEIIRPLDELLVHKAFFGFETEEYVNTGVGFGAEANNLIVAGMLREYDILLDGKHGTIGCPLLNTQALMKYGLKQNGMNTYGINLEEKLEMCKSYEEFLSKRARGRARTNSLRDMNYFDAYDLNDLEG